MNFNKEICVGFLVGFFIIGNLTTPTGDYLYNLFHSIIGMALSISVGILFGAFEKN